MNIRQGAGATGRVTIVVFSHLRWGFVFQRPQHVLTRLARHCDILFVEEPVCSPGESRLDTAAVSPGVEVVTPRLGLSAPGFADEHVDPLGRLIAALVAERRIVAPVVWFYTPMALPLLKFLEPRCVAYDCMDDLASCHFAPRELLAREGRLLDIADVVLTGGPSLHAARRKRRPDARCLPNAVDIDHFSRRTLDKKSFEAAAARALHVDIPAPRLGYMGVIDERLDLGMLDDLALRRPDWSLVMVGPIVKIDPASLPRRPNIYWLGRASYSLLPHLLRHWNLALMPFALDESTRFISPTETLEYLAAGLEVVSTALPDVIALYDRFVEVAEGADGFESAIERLLASRPNREARDRLLQPLLDVSTWDILVAQVIAAIKPWLGASVEEMPDLRLDAIGLDEPRGATPGRARTTPHRV